MMGLEEAIGVETKRHVQGREGRAEASWTNPCTFAGVSVFRVGGAADPRYPGIEHRGGGPRRGLESSAARLLEVRVLPIG